MVSFDKTVAAMSPQDMELLLRAYIRRHVHVTKDEYGGSVRIQLIGEVHYRDGTSGLKWHVTQGYESDGARGEVLSVVAQEFYRRIGWTESGAASLRLIEGTVSTDMSPPTPPEVPF
jgi:hypothetical protein